MVVGTFQKEPDEVLSPQFDFSDNLFGGSVDSAVCTVKELGTGTAYPSLLSGSPTIDSPFVTQVITAGVDGGIYVLKCSATMSGGQVIDGELYVYVVDLSS